MKKKILIAAGSVIVVTVVMAAPGCSDPETTTTPDDAGTDVSSSTTDTGGGSSSDVATGGGECTGNAECEAKLPTTTPANCAVATCDTLQKKCHFKAKDSDNDGHAAKNCSAATATIETGDDCDDTDPNTYPGAWDGPATDFDAGAGVQTDRCDQKDNDCNGSPDDGRIAVDGGDKTCKCDPNKPLPCYEYPNGVPIDPATLDVNNNPKGVCKKGARNCVNGIPSACSGAVGPAIAEQCDDADHDCDGTSGNAGDTVASAPTQCPDVDGDGYCGAPCVQACVAAVGYKPQNTCLAGTDCNDAVGTTHPNAADPCGDGVDSNCVGGDNDLYPDLGSTCFAGSPQAGYCYQQGTKICSGGVSVCSVSGHAAQDYLHTSPITDPTVVNYTDINNKWDWNCSGGINYPLNLASSGLCNNAQGVCNYVKANISANCQGPSGGYWLELCTPSFDVCGKPGDEVYCDSSCNALSRNSVTIGCK